MKQIKKAGRITVVFLLSVLTVLTVLPASAARQTMSFYFRKNGEHRQPATDPDWWYFDKYDAFYVDRTLKDTENDPEAPEKILYLTFDAGYENGNVAKIGDALRTHGAVGAFFVLPHIAKEEPELLRQLAADGNLICNHSSTHRDLSQCADKESFKAELRGLEEAVREACGIETAPFYRPPEGRFCEKNLQWAQQLGYSTVFWSFAYCDWNNDEQPDPEEAFRNIMDHTHNGAILLLHPTSATNAALMDRLLTEWEAQGYRFGTLYELKERAEAERARIEALPESNKRQKYPTK